MNKHDVAFINLWYVLKPLYYIGLENIYGIHPFDESNWMYQLFF